MTRFGDIKIDGELQLRVMSLETSQQVTVKLNRLSAQRFADMLLFYSGSPLSKNVWSRTAESFPVGDLTPPTDEQKMEKRAKEMGPVSLRRPHKVVRYRA